MVNQEWYREFGRHLMKTYSGLYLGRIWGKLLPGQIAFKDLKYYSAKKQLIYNKKFIHVKLFLCHWEIHGRLLVQKEAEIMRS